MHSDLSARKLLYSPARSQSNGLVLAKHQAATSLPSFTLLMSKRVHALQVSIKADDKTTTTSNSILCRATVSTCRSQDAVIPGCFPGSLLEHEGRHARLVGDGICGVSPGIGHPRLCPAVLRLNDAHCTSMTGASEHVSESGAKCSQGRGFASDCASSAIVHAAARHEAVHHRASCQLLGCQVVHTTVPEARLQPNNELCISHAQASQCANSATVLTHTLKQVPDSRDPQGAACRRDCLIKSVPEAVSKSDRM